MIDGNFWKRFRECFVFQRRVSTKTVVMVLNKMFNKQCYVTLLHVSILAFKCVIPTVIRDIIIHDKIWFAQLVQTSYMTKYSQLKLENMPVIQCLLQFSKLYLLWKYLKDNKHKSLHLAKKYALIFVLGHDLFWVKSFPLLSEKMFASQNR